MHVLISALARFNRLTGVCRHAANLVRALCDIRQVGRITLIIGDWQSEYFNAVFALTSEKLEVSRVNIPNDAVARNKWFVFGLPKLAAKYGPDIVHLGFPVPIMKSRFAMPLAVTVHDLYPFDLAESFGRLNGLCRRLSFRQCIRACDGVACVSEVTRTELVRHCRDAASRVPLSLVHNYSEVGQATIEILERRGSGPFLLTVAQHQANKRLDLLLLAFSELRKGNLISKELVLSIVGGKGPQSESLRQLAHSLEIDDWIEWLPSLSDGQLAWMYRNCEVFIACSAVEGFCLPLLEAVSCGCRVVASDIAVFHEVAGDRPVYFDIQANPVGNLSAGILRALASLRPEGPRTAEFSRQRTGVECLSFYSTILREVKDEEHKQRAGVSRPEF